MRNLKIVFVGLLLAFPGLAAANANDIPGTSTWYLHVDLEKMKSEEAGKPLYDWMQQEIFEEIREESGVDTGSDRCTSGPTSFA